MFDNDREKQLVYRRGGFTDLHQQPSAKHLIRLTPGNESRLSKSPQADQLQIE